LAATASTARRFPNGRPQREHAAGSSRTSTRQSSARASSGIAGSSVIAPSGHTFTQSPQFTQAIARSSSACRASSNRHAWVGQAFTHARARVHRAGSIRGTA
jgi:hypothetical protein